MPEFGSPGQQPEASAEDQVLCGCCSCYLQLPATTICLYGFWEFCRWLRPRTYCDKLSKTANVDSIPLLKKAAAIACINHGLKHCTNGFDIAPVALCNLGAEDGFRTALDANELPTRRLKLLFQHPKLKEVFTLGRKSKDDTVHINIARLLQHANPAIQFLLPTALWPSSSNTVSVNILSTPSSRNGAIPSSIQATGAAQYLHNGFGNLHLADEPSTESHSESVKSILQLLPPAAKDFIQAHLQDLE